MIYISDRKERFEVSDMETSHLVNVLGHHLTQIETLQVFSHFNPKIRLRVEKLKEVLRVLSEELIERDVDPEEYLQDE